MKNDATMFTQYYNTSKEKHLKFTFYSKLKNNNKEAKNIYIIK